MSVISYILPEVFLFFMMVGTLMFGAFISNSFKIVNKITILSLFFTLALVINLNNTETLIFNESFVLDSFSIYMKAITLIFCALVLIISNEYIVNLNLNKFEYPFIVTSSVLGMMIMISSNDLILFYLGLELQSLSLYVLAAFDRDNEKSTESGVKYFVLSALSSGLLLYGCSLIYGFTGSTNFQIIANELNDNNIGSIFGIVFVIVGLAFKISAVPFHMWTPDVYEGSPTAVTSFFATIPKIAAISVIIRIMYVPFLNVIEHWQTILIFISIASMIVGAVAAIGQKNIKRLMAYSSIGHMGYALAGIATGTDHGIKSSIIYLTIYLVMNLGVFSCIFMLKRKDKFHENIDDLSGLSRNHPMLSLSFLIFFFSLAGIPPLAGFFAKFHIFMAVIEAKLYLLAVIGLVTTVIAAFYYLRVIKIIYFDESKKPFEESKNFGLRLTLFVSSIFVLVYFIFPSILMNLVSSISFL